MNYSPNWIAPLLACAIALSYAPAWAGPGHDHGDEAAPVTAGGPQRQPDGSVFLPKPAQRQMSLRTLPVQSAELPRAIELQGLVVMDPNAGGQVQATQAGRLVPPPQGFPSLGQRVQRGQLLAYVEPVTGALERSAQTAQIAELRSAQELAQKRLARLRELADTVPRREIEATESELQSLKSRLIALGGGLTGREALSAPVSGVIASSRALAGQVIDARELVFEVVDPQRLRVEALAYEPSAGTRDHHGLHRPRRSTSSAEAFGRCRQSARPGLAHPLRAAKCERRTGGRPAGPGGGAEQAAHQGLLRACCSVDEEPVQPDHRLGQDGSRALRAQGGHGDTAGRCQRCGDPGSGRGRPRGHPGCHPGQPSPLKEPPCSSGFWTAAWPTGCWY
jgi:hypothetical protein